MAEKIKILIAEDEKAIARAMDLKLQYEGFETKVAVDGQQALDFLQAEKFDLLILDLIMPQLDGFKVLAAMKEKNIKTPVIITSNLSQQEDIDKAKELGAFEFFIKSDTPIAQIVEKIKNFFKL